MINAIPELTSPEKNRGMVRCTVIQVDVGERAFGMSASRGDLLLTIRAYYEEEMNRLRESLEALARSEAERDHLKVRFSMMTFSRSPPTIKRVLTRSERSATRKAFVCWRCPKRAAALKTSATS
jgi:hypothetical protein